MQPLGRAADGKKEKTGGKQDDGRSGGDVERIGEQYAAHGAEGSDEHGIERHLSQAMRQLIRGGAENGTLSYIPRPAPSNSG